MIKYLVFEKTTTTLLFRPLVSKDCKWWSYWDEQILQYKMLEDDGWQQIVRSLGLSVGGCVCDHACVGVTRLRRDRQKPEGSIWCLWCFTHGLHHDPVSIPSLTSPHTPMCTDAYMPTTHTLVIPVFCPLSQTHHHAACTVSRSQTSLSLSHTHTRGHADLGIQCASGWFMGVSIVGQGVALGWTDTLDWANRACLALLVDWLSSRSDAVPGRQVEQRATWGSKLLSSVLHHTQTNYLLNSVAGVFNSDKAQQSLPETTLLSQTLSNKVQPNKFKCHIA